MLVANWFALLVLFIAATGLFLARTWRWQIIFTAVQYATVFWFVQTQAGIAIGAVKLITGWMVCAVIVLSHPGSTSSEEKEALLPPEQFFRLVTISIALALSLAAAGNLSNWLGVSFPLAWGALFLIGTGLIVLGFTSQPFRIILGLLTTLAGFEMVYVTVEKSVLVAGLLAGVNLSLGLVGAYYLTLQAQEETE